MAKNNTDIHILRYLQNREYDSSKWPDNVLLRQRLNNAENLFRKDLYEHYGCVNAIEFSNGGEWLVSGGDDRRVLMWNIEKAINGVGAPISMKGEHGSNIFCLGFDSNNHKIYSAGNDELVIVHDTNTSETVEVFLHEEAVYGISVDPLNDNVFASACDDGRILIWDIRERSNTEAFCLASYNSAFHAVMYNPVEPRLLATANSKEGVGLWDVRMPKKCLLRYGASPFQQSCMSVRFNRQGTNLLALRRRLPPVLYNIDKPAAVCQFDNPGYYNSCTMKSCCFAGDNDQYVVSGSDDFNLYVWKIPEDTANSSWVEQAHLVLQGHRSIVNQVRFNHNNFVFASSGVEKIIKLWSPFEVTGSSGGLDKGTGNRDRERKVYSHEEYINLVLSSGEVMSHDYSHKSTQEDTRMMAFFDSLVQREIEGSTSDSSVSSLHTDSWLYSSIPDNLSVSEVDSENSSDDNPTASLQLSALSAAYASIVASSINSTLNQENNRDSIPIPPATQPEAEQDNVTSEGPNRISQLIAQKRSQLLQKDGKKDAKSKKSKKVRKIKITIAGQSTNNGGISSSSGSSSSDTDTAPATTPMFRLTESTRHPEDRRVILRKRRAKLLNDQSDSDSNNQEELGKNKISKVDLNGAMGESSRTCACKDKSDNNMNESSTSNENKCKKCVNGNTTDGRTSDSGIASHSGDNGEVAGGSGASSSGSAASRMQATQNPVQFKRIKSKMERVQRRYRKRGSGSEARDSD